MQAAVNRLPDRKLIRQGEKSRAKPHLATADDAALLGALAHCCGRHRARPTTASRFSRSTSGSAIPWSCRPARALDWDEAECLQRRCDRRPAREFFDDAGGSGRTGFPRWRGRRRALFPAEARAASAEAKESMAALPAQPRRPHRRSAGRAHAAGGNAPRQPDRIAQPPRLHREDRAGRARAVARDLQHAVLVVDMLRFSRINESMGSLAGDELLITFARRLMSALRGGDVLARTGGNEFGVLVTLRRGVADALAAADRIQEVLAAPFKISDLEIRVECAIGLALMTARTGRRRAVSQRPVRGQAGQAGRKTAGLRGAAGERGAPSLLDRDRASPGARQGPAQALLPAADRPQIRRGRRLRGACPLGP